MNAPTALDIEARIDALSEQYAAYLSDDQLATFWGWYDRHKDAALVYLEQCVERLLATRYRTDYLNRLDHGRGIGTSWEPCPDCGEPTENRNGKAGRCAACQVLWSVERTQRRKRAATPAPLQVQCPNCRRWFDRPLPKSHNGHGWRCGRETPPAPTPARAGSAPRPRGNPGQLTILGNRAKWRTEQEDAA